MPHNMVSIRNLSDTINEKLSPKAIRVFSKAISNMGGPNSGKFPVLNYNNTDKIECQNYISNNLKDFKKTSDEKPEVDVCYAAKANAYVIRATGRIGKCTVALDNPKNDLGYLDKEGRMHVSDRKSQPWLKGLSSMNEQHLSCPIHYL